MFCQVELAADAKIMVAPVHKSKIVVMADGQKFKKSIGKPLQLTVIQYNTVAHKRGCMVVPVPAETRLVRHAYRDLFEDVGRLFENRMEFMGDGQMGEAKLAYMRKKYKFNTATSNVVPLSPAVERKPFEAWVVEYDEIETRLPSHLWGLVRQSIVSMKLPEAEVCNTIPWSFLVVTVEPNIQNMPVMYVHNLLQKQFYIPLYSHCIGFSGQRERINAETNERVMQVQIRRQPETQRKYAAMSNWTLYMLNDRAVSARSELYEGGCALDIHYDEDEDNLLKFYEAVNSRRMPVCVTFGKIGCVVRVLGSVIAEKGFNDYLFV